jgi:hypothetical protein
MSNPIDDIDLWCAGAAISEELHTKNTAPISIDDHVEVMRTGNPYQSGYYASGTFNKKTHILMIGGRSSILTQPFYHVEIPDKMKQSLGMSDDALDSKIPFPSGDASKAWAASKGLIKHPDYVEAKQFRQDLLDKLQSDGVDISKVKVVHVGHSKDGMTSQLSVIEHRDDYAITFDSPGVKDCQEAMGRNLSNLEDRILNIKVKNSIISNEGTPIDAKEMVIDHGVCTESVKEFTTRTRTGDLLKYAYQNMTKAHSIKNIREHLEKLRKPKQSTPPALNPRTTDPKLSVKDLRLSDNEIVAMRANIAQKQMDAEMPKVDFQATVTLKPFKLGKAYPALQAKFDADDLTRLFRKEYYKVETSLDSGIFPNNLEAFYAVYDELKKFIANSWPIDFGFPNIPYNEGAIMHRDLWLNRVLYLKIGLDNAINEKFYNPELQKKLIDTNKLCARDDKTEFLKEAKLLLPKLGGSAHVDMMNLMLQTHLDEGDFQAARDLLAQKTDKAANEKQANQHIDQDYKKMDDKNGSFDHAVKNSNHFNDDVLSPILVFMNKTVPDALLQGASATLIIMAIQKLKSSLQNRISKKYKSKDDKSKLAMLLTQVDDLKKELKTMSTQTEPLVFYGKEQIDEIENAIKLFTPGAPDKKQALPPVKMAPGLSANFLSYLMVTQPHQVGNFLSAQVLTHQQLREAFERRPAFNARMDGFKKAIPIFFSTTPFALFSPKNETRPQPTQVQTTKTPTK